MNILAFGAHPDDIEYSVAGTLLKYKQQGHKIFIALATSGNTGSNEIPTREEIAATREAEMKEAAKFYDAELRFLRYDDERLFDCNQARTDVLDAIRWAQPDVIFTHAPTDPSPDHAAISKMVSAMMLSLPGKLQQATLPPCEKTPSLFFWEHGMGVNYLPEVYVDISDVFEIKKKALSMHKSQSAWMEVFGSGLTADIEKMNAFRGLQCGCEYAETFSAFRIHGYMPNFKLLP
ncbi:MAG: PIG-L family deacetylase [Oscillospiraceae bacterium]|nr:PIG-L family deacetylase [Oscillospiraceae bacterium]